MRKKTVLSKNELVSRSQTFPGKKNTIPLCTPLPEYFKEKFNYIWCAFFMYPLILPPHLSKKCLTLGVQNKLKRLVIKDYWRHVLENSKPKKKDFSWKKCQFLSWKKRWKNKNIKKWLWKYVCIFCSFAIKTCIGNRPC